MGCCFSGREFGTRALEHLSLSLCCESASGLFAQELSNYCDYCQHLKCWIEVPFARGSICSSLLFDFVSPSVWLDLYLHRRKRSGCRGIRQSTKIWLKLALVLVRTRPCGQRTLWVSELCWTLGYWSVGKPSVVNRRLLTCILLSDSALTHTQPPLSLFVSECLSTGPCYCLRFGSC